MKKAKIVIILVLVFAVIITGSVFGINKYCEKIRNDAYEDGREYERKYQEANEVPVNTTAIIEQRLETAARLETADFFCNCVDNYQDKINLKEDLKIPVNLDLPLTSKSFLVSYDGTVSAGIKDLSKAKVTENEDGTLTITLPEVEIFETTLNNDSLEIFDEKNNILNEITIKDYNDSQIRIKDKIKEEALKNGIIKTAQKNAEIVIKSMFADIDKEVKIEWTK